MPEGHLHEDGSGFHEDVFSRHFAVVSGGAMTRRMGDRRQPDQSEREEADAVPTPVHPGDRCQRGAGCGAGEVDGHVDGVEAAARGGDQTKDSRLIGYLRHLRAYVEYNHADDQRGEMEERR